METETSGAPAPDLMEALAEVHAEAARGVETLLTARKVGDDRVSGITALRNIEIRMRDLLEPRS